MNFFLLIGELSILLGSIYLILIVLVTKSYAGISAKTQLLYYIVYFTRNFDESDLFISIMMIFLAMLLMLSYRFRQTYDKEYDSFWAEILLVSCVTLAVFVKRDSSPFSILTALSEYLEAVAFLPQIYMVWKCKKLSRPIFVYIFYIFWGKLQLLLYWIYLYCVYGKLNVRSGAALAVDLLILLSSRLIIRSSRIMPYEFAEKVTKCQNIFIYKAELPATTETKSDDTLPLVTEEASVDQPTEIISVPQK